SRYAWKLQGFISLPEIEIRQTRGLWEEGQRLVRKSGDRDPHRVVLLSVGVARDVADEWPPAHVAVKGKDRSSLVSPGQPGQVHVVVARCHGQDFARCGVA